MHFKDGVRTEELPSKFATRICDGRDTVLMALHKKKPGAMGLTRQHGRLEKYCKSESYSVVPGAGIEPARLAAGDFESPASTNFTTRARGSRARPGDGCGRCEDRDYMRSFSSCQATARRACRPRGRPGLLNPARIPTILTSSRARTSSSPARKSRRWRRPIPARSSPSAAGATGFPALATRPGPAPKRRR